MSVAATRSMLGPAALMLVVPSWDAWERLWASGFGQACLLVSACGCSRAAYRMVGLSQLTGADAPVQLTDDGSVMFDAQNGDDSAAESGWLLGPPAEGGPSDSTAVGDGLEGAAMREAAICNGGEFFTSQVDGSSVSFDPCMVTDYYTPSPGIYTYFEINCRGLVIRIGGGVWGTCTCAATVEYDTGTRYTGNGTVKFTSFGAVGEYVDGTLSAPNLQGPSSISLEGSFHLCRGPDYPAPGP